MFTRWNEQYQRLMLSTKFLSQLAAFWVFMLAGLGLISLSKAVYYNYPLAEDTWQYAIRSALLHGFIALSFAMRFILLFRRSLENFVAAQLSWLLASASIFLYLADFKGYWLSSSDGFAIYDMGYLDPLIGNGMLFLIFSIIRFLIVSIVAYLRIK